MATAPFTVKSTSVIDGPSDVALAIVYLRMLREMVPMPDGPPVALLDLVFYESAPSLTEFLDMGKTTDSRVALLGCEIRPSMDANPTAMLDPTAMLTTIAGISWLNGVGPMGSGKIRGEIGFAFFDDVSAFRKVAIASEMIDWAFREKNLDVLVGTTPEQNIKAIRFSRLLGFDTTSKVRNYTTWRGHLTDVVISSMTRAGWEEQRGA